MGIRVGGGRVECPYGSCMTRWEDGWIKGLMLGGMVGVFVGIALGLALA